MSARLAAGPGEDESHTWLPKIEGHVRAKSQYAKVFVCGYDGFRLLYHARSEVFTHALDFSFEQAEEDYYGHDLFVLVRRPDGLAGMESVHRRYPDMYVYGHGPTQGAGFWGEWRLFQIIRAPRREKR